MENYTALFNTSNIDASTFYMSNVETYLFTWNSIDYVLIDTNSTYIDFTKTIHKNQLKYFSNLQIFNKLCEVRNLQTVKYLNTTTDDIFSDYIEQYIFDNIKNVIVVIDNAYDAYVKDLSISMFPKNFVNVVTAVFNCNNSTCQETKLKHYIKIYCEYLPNLQIITLNQNDYVDSDKYFKNLEKISKYCFKNGIVFMHD